MMMMWCMRRAKRYKKLEKKLLLYSTSSKGKTNKISNNEDRNSGSFHYGVSVRY